MRPFSSECSSAQLTAQYERLKLRLTLGALKMVMLSG